MGRFQTSLELAKTSWKVLQRDRELLWLPVIGFTLSALIAGVALGISFLVDYDIDTSTMEAGPATTVAWIVAGLAIATITSLVQGSLVSGAAERMRGGDPTVSSAIGGALARLPQLLGWTIITSTVGLILRAIRERSGIVGDIFAGLLDMAWQVITFLVVPVIVLEKKGPIEAVKRSTELLRTTWGENLIGRFGLGLVGMLAMLPALVPILIGVQLGGAGLVIGIAIGAVWIGLIAVIMTALTAIYQTALYDFAANNHVPEDFVGTGLDTAFESREGGPNTGRGGFGGPFSSGGFGGR
ncbi:MAG: DUF6159 family protein [Acidimicrobiales bacterium]